MSRRERRKDREGTKFVDFKEAGDPVLLGEIYSKEGADELVYLDITASSEGRSTFTDLVKRVASVSTYLLLSEAVSTLYKI